MTELRLGELLAYRSWRLTRKDDGWTIRSMVVKKVWRPHEPMTGDPNGPKLFGDSMGAGVYAFARQDDRSINFSNHDNLPHVVVGAVWLWGEVHVHQLGYRAEYAYPANFTDLISIRDHLPHVEQLCVLKSLIERYL